MRKNIIMKGKENKAITLIALIVTIIVLIILAGISMNLLLGENGLIQRAKDASLAQKKAQLEEKLEMAKVIAFLDEYETGTNMLDHYLNALKKENLIEESDINKEESGAYVTLEEKYVYYVQEIDGEIVYTYSGQSEKILPRIVDVRVSNTTNSITINVTTSKANSYKFYIKESSNDNYELKEQNNISGTYVFEQLEEGKTYNIKVEAINENGVTQKEITRTIVLIPKGKVNIENWVWNAGTETGTFEIRTEETGYILQYTTTPAIESSWVTVQNGERTTGITVGQTVYARLSDGENNETGNFSSVTVEKQNGNVVLSSVAGQTTLSNSITFNITSNLSGGTLSVNSSDETVATVNLSGNVVTVQALNKEGTSQITVTSAESEIYKEATATYTILVSKEELTSVNVQMTGYQYGETKTDPTISGQIHGGTVTYYYNTNNSNSNGNLWSTVTDSTSLNAGTYYMYAVIGETQNYKEYITPTTTFNITKRAGYITLSETQADVESGTDVHSFTVSSSHGGVISSSETTNTVATVSTNGNTITVGNLENLDVNTTVTIRVTCLEDTNYTAAYSDYTITIIRAIPYSGSLIEYWPLQNNLESALNNSTLGTLQVGENSTADFTGGGFNIASGGAGLKSSSNSYQLPEEFTFVMEINPTSLKAGFLFGISTNPQGSNLINSIGIFESGRYRVWNGRYGNEYISNTINLNSWNRLVVTGNSTGWKVYCNGSLAGSRTDGYNRLTGTFFIGKCYVNGVIHNYSGTEAINGKIRNCALYNRVLSESEIQTITFE